MFPVKICPAPIYSCEHTDVKMIVCGLLLSFSLLVWGNYEDVYLEDVTPSDLEPGLDFVSFFFLYYYAKMHMGFW